MTAVTREIKRCSRCRKDRPLAVFPLNRWKKPDSWCRPCRAEDAVQLSKHVKRDRVIVFAAHNSFRGQRGRVVQREPFIMVLLDGERLPMRFEPNEIVPEDDASSRAMTNE